jgi:hypothetical protein
MVLKMKHKAAQPGVAGETGKQKLVGDDDGETDHGDRERAVMEQRDAKQRQRE